MASACDEHREAGNAAFASGDLPLALREYTRALKAAPGEARALANRSMILRTLGRLQEAMADAQACVDAHPEFVRGYQRLGEAHQALAEQDLVEARKTSLEVEMISKITGTQFENGTLISGAHFAAARLAYLAGHKAETVNRLRATPAHAGKTFADMFAVDMLDLGARLNGLNLSGPGGGDSHSGNPLLSEGLWTMETMTPQLRADAITMYAAATMGRDSDLPRAIRDSVQAFLDTLTFGPSPLHGYGAFATRALKKGEVLFELSSDDDTFTPGLDNSISMALIRMETMMGPLNDACGTPDLHALAKAASQEAAMAYLQSLQSRSEAAANIKFEHPPDRHGNVFVEVPAPPGFNGLGAGYTRLARHACIRISATKDVAEGEELTRGYSAAEWIREGLVMWSSMNPREQATCGFDATAMTAAFKALSAMSVETAGAGVRGAGQRKLARVHADRSMNIVQALAGTAWRRY